jgi:transcriptional regulator with XRE-family HTH domain
MYAGGIDTDTLLCPFLQILYFLIKTILRPPFVTSAYYDRQKYLIVKCFFCQICLFLYYTVPMNNDETTGLFHDRLREAYEASGMPVKEIAYRSGVKKLTIDNWLTPSKKTMPKVTEAAKVARAIGTTVEYLVFGVEPKAVPERLRKLVDLLSGMGSDDLEAILIMAQTLQERSKKKKPPIQSAS